MRIATSALSLATSTAWAKACAAVPARSLAPVHEGRVAHRVAAAEKLPVGVAEFREQHHRAVEQRRLGRHSRAPVALDRLGIVRARRDAAPGRARRRPRRLAGSRRGEGRRLKPVVLQAMSSVTATGQWSEAFGRSQPVRGKRSTSWPGGKIGAPGLAAAHDVGHRLCVAPRQRRRQQDIVELAQMPLLRPARVVERPAVEFGPPLDDVLAEAVGQQHVEARHRLVDHLKPVAADRRRRRSPRAGGSR